MDPRDPLEKTAGLPRAQRRSLADTDPAGRRRDEAGDCLEDAKVVSDLDVTNQAINLPAGNEEPAQRASDLMVLILEDVDSPARK